MPEFEITVEFDVYCATCGAGLCRQSSTTQRGRGNSVEVEACGKCMDSAESKGYDEGYEAARKVFDKED